MIRERARVDLRSPHSLVLDGPQNVHPLPHGLAVNAVAHCSNPTLAGPAKHQLDNDLPNEYIPFVPVNCGGLAAVGCEWSGYLLSNQP